MIAPGVMGYWFDGVNDVVGCGNNSSFDITDAVTIAGWICLKEYKSYNYIGGKDGAYMLASEEEKLKPHIRVDGAWRFCPTEKATPLNLWSYWAVTYSESSKTIKAYLNGQEEGSEVLSGLTTYKISTSNNPVCIAHYQLASSVNTKCLIAQPVIENRVWSEAEVRENMYESPIYRMLRGLPYSQVYVRVPWKQQGGIYVL